MKHHALINPTLLATFSLLLTLSFQCLAEEEFAVDQADSMDIEAFHKSDDKGEKSSNPIIDFFTGKKNKSGVKFEGNLPVGLLQAFRIDVPWDGKNFVVIAFRQGS